MLETYTCTDDPWLPNVTGSATNCANSCNGMRVCVKLFQLNGERTKAHWDKSPLGQKPTGQYPTGQKPTA